MSVQGPNDWPGLDSLIAGESLTRHAVLTYSGTWEPPGVGYASDVVNGLIQYVNPKLCYEVPVIYPASFGPVQGPISSPGYQQSITDAINWTAQWLAANPTRTFALSGYSQGAEAASRVLIELQSGSLRQYLPNFIGGVTFGNPCRGAGMHAPTIADPGGRGISATQIAELPSVNGQIVWADYVHSKANGDAALDMYSSVPCGLLGSGPDLVGTDMTDVYTIATNLQFNNFGGLIQSMVTALTKAAYDSGLVGAFKGGLTGLFEMGFDFIYGLIAEVISPTAINAHINAAEADGIAAMLGLDFLMCPGGPTASHISYEGEIPGYSNLVAQAVGFLNQIATLTPPRI